MLKFEDGKLKFHNKIARFKRFGVPDSKYTSDVQYWTEFVSRWWHHTDLTFEDVAPTEEQQARLDELNAQTDLDDIHNAEAMAFVENGIILPDTEAPFLKPLIDRQAPATLKHFQSVAKDKAREQRWIAETAGTELNGMKLNTNERSQQRVTSLVTAVTADPDADNFDFEIQPGEWVTIDRDTAIAIGKAVSNHVQACFTHCKNLHDQIQAAETLDALAEIDVTTGWPV